MTAAAKMTPVTGKKGFTLIELLFVIIIVGVLAGGTLPGFRNAFINLQLDSFASQLQTFMNYLSQRAIVEGEIVYLHIDNDNKDCWAQFKDDNKRLKSSAIPAGIEIELDNKEKQVTFFPDGSIDKVGVKLTNRLGRTVSLTTKGTYGRFKLQAQ